MIEYAQGMCAQYGLLQTQTVGPICHCVVYDPEVVRAIMTNKAQFYHKASDKQKEIMRPLLHNGLLLSEDAYWKQQRTLMSPGFHFWFLEEMLPIIVSCIDGWCQKVEESLPTGQDGASASVELEMSHEMATMTLDSVATAAFGQGFRSNRARADRFIHALKQVLDSLQSRTLNLLGFIPILKDMPCPSLRAVQQGCATIDGIVAEIVADRKAGKTTVIEGGVHSGTESLRQRAAEQDGGSGQVRRRDLLDLLLDAQANMPAGQTLTDKGVQDESVNFIAAGAETTSNLCIWMLWRLVTEPAATQGARTIMQKVREEVDRVCEGAFPSIAMLKDLKYLEAVAYESLRLHAPAPTIPKYCVTPHDIELSGGRSIHVPQGTTFLISANVIHRLPQYWPDPLKFKPDRFLAGEDMEQGTNVEDDSSASVAASAEKPSAAGKAPLSAEEKARKAAQPFAFLGFSAGPRKCIGKNLAMIEIKVIFCLLIQRFEFELVPGQYIAPSPITRLPRNGIKINVKRRTIPRAHAADQQEAAVLSEGAHEGSEAAAAAAVRQRTTAAPALSVLKPLGMI